MRPIKGQLGNAPREPLALQVRGSSIWTSQFKRIFRCRWIGDEGKRKINLRVDALNVLNHPVFFWNNLGNTPFGMGTFPTEFNGNECISDPSLPLASCPTVAVSREARFSQRLTMMHGPHLTGNRYRIRRRVDASRPDPG